MGLPRMDVGAILAIGRRVIDTQGEAIEPVKLLSMLTARQVWRRPRVLQLGSDQQQVP